MAARNNPRSEEISLPASSPPLDGEIYDTEDEDLFIPLRRFKEPKPYLSLDVVYGRSYDADGSFIPEEFVEVSSFHFRGCWNIISSLFGSCFGFRRREEAYTIIETEVARTSPPCSWRFVSSYGLGVLSEPDAEDEEIDRLCRLENISFLDLNNPAPATQSSHVPAPRTEPAQHGTGLGISEDSWVTEIHDGCTWYYYRGMCCTRHNCSPEEAPADTPHH